jgi:hypothetical protein
MKKLMLALLAGGVIGFTASAVAKSAGKTGGPCGPHGLVCAENQECCMSPHPFTWRCTAAGRCPYNR